MTVFNLTLDTWAAGRDSTSVATLVIQSTCLFLSFLILLARLYQQKNISFHNKSNMQIIGISLLQITHLLALFFSILYVFVHEWNYIHLYKTSNPMDCETWYFLIMISTTTNYILVYTFLMLRSSLAFNTDNLRIPLKITFTVILCIWLGFLICVSITLSDFTGISPIPNSGFCFRILGNAGTAGLSFYHVVNATSGIVAVVIFWSKSRSVKALLINNQSSGGLNEAFQKHIFLGICIALSSIIMFFVTEFFTVLVGMCYAFHQLAINLYILLLFKDNDKLYQLLCCRSYWLTKNEDRNDDASKLSEIVNKNKNLTANDTTNATTNELSIQISNSNSKNGVQMTAIIT